MYEGQNISQEAAQKLLISGKYQEDEELSQVLRRPVFQLADGKILLYIPDDRCVLYKRREDLVAVLFEN